MTTETGECRAGLAGELVLLALLAVLWGASYTLIKIGVATIPPVTLIAGRTLLAGLVLLAVLRLRGLRLPRGRAVWAAFAVQACLNSVLPFTLIAWAEQHVEAGLAVILNSTTPVFAFLIALAVSGRAAATAPKLFGVATGLAGIVLVVGPAALSGLGRDLAAQLAIVLATLAYGGAAVFGARFRGLDAIVPATGSLLCGAALLLPLSLALDRPWTLAPAPASLWALVALALSSTALAFVIYFRLFRTLGPVGATAQAYLRVPVGVAIAALFLGERLGPGAHAGLALVVLGVAAMTVPAGVLARYMRNPARAAMPARSQGGKR